MAESLNDKATVIGVSGRGLWLRRLTTVVVGIVLAVFYSALWPRIADAYFWSKSPAIRDVVEHVMDRNGIAGSVVAIGYEGESPQVSAFGLTTDGREMPPNESFSLASLSKPITAAAVMRLIDEGTFSLDDRLVDLVPIARTARDQRYADITVRHLLQHSGGWTRPANFGLTGDDCSPVAREEMSYSLGFAPGEHYVYSNIGYCWLELIISTRSGSDYETYVRKVVLDPAGAELKLENRLIGGFGGWAGTAADCFRFFSRPPMTAQVASRALLEDPAVYYGLGVAIVDEATGHWGSFLGAKRVFTLALRAPSGATVVALFNDYPRDARATAAKALMAFRRDLARRPGTPPP
ncbi:serine hydrolase domain-containing protein [Sinorhizobium fredii]|uniref:serine hydrolase domain-containing protein n=1 Tax=Rhizobium fredii TaxID=380 RepID=UPI0004B16460|nr:serine hydrolase domain-containing protein [Sinorhizobium fredii]AWM28203.1 Beta-lactamase [Sinorhizobium fredii CCBAU 25509]